MDRVRRFLVWLVIAGIIGMAADLVLLEHYEDWWQLAPLALLALAAGAAAWIVAVPGRASVRAFRASMALLMAGGIAGLWLHYGANIEFERELAPDSAGLGLVWNAIKGAAPPTLAPANLVHLGLLGLVSTYGWPRIEGDGA
jgi:hypothetical protein